MVAPWPSSETPLVDADDIDDIENDKKKARVSKRGAILNAAVKCTIPDFAFSPYVCLLMVGFILYTYLGGSLKSCSNMELLAYASTIAEGLGLLVLRMKINRKGSVAGISGNSMTMFALTYTVRLWQLWPRASGRLLEKFAVESLSLISLLMVLDTLICVCLTYRKSYQEDLDVLRVRYLVPYCFIAALFIHPTFIRGFFYSYFWTLEFYLETVSLLPQVVMMAQSDGKVSAPISHFVAATTLSRSIDLWWWFRGGIDLGPQGYFYGFNFSGWLIVVGHVFGLLLAADFMYYYLKARLFGSKLSDDLVLPFQDI